MELLARPTTDGYGTVTIAEYGGWYVQIMPMLFNDRLVLTPMYAPYVYDYGWDFPKGLAAWLAASAWDMDAEGEPVGFIKRIGSTPRRAKEEAIPD